MRFEHMPAGRGVSAALSDLFFNYAHDNFDGLPEDAEDGEVTAALKLDAEPFAGSLAILGFEVPIDDLVADFLGRL